MNTTDKTNKTKIKEGNRVRYIGTNNNKPYRRTECYPPAETLGTVLEVYNNHLLVQWDSGTRDDGEWYCDIVDVERVQK